MDLFANGPLVGPGVPAGYRPNGTWPVVLVGEAPGEEEVKAGCPFVGPAGRLLTVTLAEHGIGRRRIWMTNVFWIRPPEGRISHFFGSTEPMPPWPTFDRTWPILEVRDHIRRLVEEIRTLRPSLIVAVGRTALWATTGLSLIGAAAGHDHRPLAVYGGGVVRAVRHPAWALRADRRRREAWEREMAEAARAIHAALSRPGAGRSEETGVRTREEAQRCRF